MNQQQVIREIKLICIEEAANFKVPPAIIEIELFRKILRPQKWRILLPAYLKDGPLYRLLFNWNGTFNVILNQTNPVIEFNDSCAVAGSPHRGTFKWDELIHLHRLPHMPLIKDEIALKLATRIIPILVEYMIISD